MTRTEKRKAWEKAYEQRPDVRARRRAYEQRPDVRARRRAYKRTYMRTYLKNHRIRNGTRSTHEDLLETFAL